MIIAPELIFHTGIAVACIQEAKVFYEATLAVEWAPVHQYRLLRLWVAETGWCEVEIDAVYSRHGPHRMELIQGPKGSFYDPALMQTPSHTGIWAQDVGIAVERLTGLGWSVLAAKGSPAERYGNMAYVTNDGFVLELVGRELQPMLEAWFVEPDTAELSPA